MLKATKKINEVKKGGVGNLANAAMMFMQQERERIE
jgi:hypothetical protein